MRQRSLSREAALEEYLVYRKRLREFLDMAQIVTDINGSKYQPRDLQGRGPERFAHTIGNSIMGLFASLLDPQSHALNVFDVWIALFPSKTDRIKETWEAVRPHVQLIRDYRNDIACHVNKNLRRHAKTYLDYHKHLDKIAGAMQTVLQLAAELLRDEPTALPKLRVETESILDRALAPLVKGVGPSQRRVVLTALKEHFLPEE